MESCRSLGDYVSGPFAGGTTDGNCTNVGGLRSFKLSILHCGRKTQKEKKNEGFLYSFYF